MKNRKVLCNVLGIISLAMLAYCLIAYSYLQSQLTGDLAELTTKIKTIGNLVIPALAIVGVYHLVLLVNALKSLSGKLIDSVYIVLVILSGITLLSDLLLLSEIGKEYMLWDVTDQWVMLYGFTVLHILVVVCGLIYTTKHASSGVLNKDAGNKDNMFRAIHHIGLLSGILGFCGVVIAQTELIVPGRYATPFMFLLAGLAVFPLILFGVYWIIKLKEIPIREWWDEKQLSDTAIAALISFIVAIPLYILICALNIAKIELHATSWILGIFFVQLGVLCAVVIARNR